MCFCDMVQNYYAMYQAPHSNNRMPALMVDYQHRQDQAHLHTKKPAVEKNIYSSYAKIQTQK